MRIQRNLAASTFLLWASASAVSGCFSLQSRVDGSVDRDAEVQSDVTALDQSEPSDDSGACAMGSTRCPGTQCLNLQSDLAHCGSCDNACPTIREGVASCQMGVCGFSCNAGFERLGNGCVAVGGFPRPRMPLSLGNVSVRRPNLLWELPPGATGAMLELCRDRACTMSIESRAVVGTAALPTSDLPPNRVVFWRLRAMVGDATSTVFSPTWLFHVPATSNRGDINTSSNPHLDVNGDGFDDVAVGAPNVTVAAMAMAGTVSVFHGPTLGPAPARVLAGEAGGEKLGSVVASAGDVNGDGFGDLVVGANAASPGGVRSAGIVRVYLGGPAGIAAMPTRVLSGSIIDENFGGAVASAGDVNRDGYADLVIGAFGATPGAVQFAGSASVFHGSAVGIAAMPTLVLSGTNQAERFGIAVSSAGDIDGDGYSDLVVGADYADPNGQANAGAARVYRGGPAGISAMPSQVLNGVGAGDNFGKVVASAGDLNGDGYDDLVATAPNASASARANAGTASVFHGGPAGLVVAAARVLEGAVAGERFGAAVGGAVDVNGDGFGDLVIGAFLAAPRGNMAAGRAALFLGSASGVALMPDRVLEGPSVLARFGSAISGAGDVNGDGFDDFVVGAYSATVAGRASTGTATVFFGDRMGISPLAPMDLSGSMPNDQFGWSVASIDAVLEGLSRPSRAHRWSEYRWLRSPRRGS